MNRKWYTFRGTICDSLGVVMYFVVRFKYDS